MKISPNVLISAALVLLAVPALCAQDLSKYRGFSLGSTLAVVSKQAQVPLDQIATVHQSPALIQQLTLWLIDSSDGAEQDSQYSVVLSRSPLAQSFGARFTLDNVTGAGRRGYR
jgi:hypothetical protein